MVGANSQSTTTTIKFTSQQKHQYYFVTCFTPGNVTFSYKATVVHTYYDYKDFGEKRCSVRFGLPTDKECFMDIAANDSVTLFAHVNPNNKSSSKAQITVDAFHLLPPPSVLLFMFVFVVLLPLLSMIVYTFKYI